MGQSLLSDLEYYMGIIIPTLQSVTSINGIMNVKGLGVELARGR